MEGFVHGHGKIGLCSLKQWLRMSQIPELMAIDFEPVHPGHGQLDRRYRAHPAIEKFLGETSLIPSVEGKRIRFDFYGSSAWTERPHLHESNTWFLRASFCFTRDRNFSHVLHERKIRQETSLNAASKLIAYACSDVSAAGTTEVEILVHGFSRNKIRRGTLQGWLPSDEIDEMTSLEIEPIHPGIRKPFMSDPTVQTFYATTALQGDPAAGTDKRLRVIHHGTEEVNKGGRPKGSTKAAVAARAAASTAAADTTADCSGHAWSLPPLWQ